MPILSRKDLERISRRVLFRYLTLSDRKMDRIDPVDFAEKICGLHFAFADIAICFQPRQERPSVFISELKDVFSTAHSLRLYDLHVTATSRASESREHSLPICSHPAAAFPL